MIIRLIPGSLEYMRRLLLVLLLGIVLAAPVLGQQTAAGKVNAKDVDSLIKDLKDDNSTIRANAAELLGTINDTGAVYPLIYALKDENLTVRRNATAAIGAVSHDYYSIISLFKNS